MSKVPAILGGKPAFPQKVSIVKPLLPTYAALEADIADILQTGMVTKGRHLTAFEEAVAEHLKVKHAIGVSSCTTGLMLVYQALNLSGDVVVPSFTFMATVSALVWAGLRPVFADVDPGTTNLTPEAAEAAITPSTCAIVGVHNFGNPTDIRALTEVSQRHGIHLVFDAAHGFGAQYQGVPVGPQGDAHIYSLSPTKLLIAGEGGIVATNNDALADKIRMGREYGNSGAYDSAFAGINARLAEFNALLGLQSLAMLEQAALHRNQVVEQYRQALSPLPGIGFQVVRPGDRCSYKDFSITIDPSAFGISRDQLAKALTAENIDTRTYYNPPVHRQTAYHQFASDPANLIHTDWLSENSLSLPVWSHMPADIVTGICATFKNLHEAAHEIHQVGP